MKSAQLVRQLRTYGVWLLAAAVAGICSFAPPSALQRLDLLTYDKLEPLFRGRQLNDEAVIVAIDDYSLASFGHWPWGRALHAQLIDLLSDEGVLAIGLPILLIEESDEDEILTAALQRSGRTVLAVAPVRTEHGIAELQPSAPLKEAAAALGHVDVELDVDALARRIFRRAGMGEARWESLAVATLRQARESLDSTHRPGLDAAPSLQRTNHSQHWLRKDEILLPIVDAASTPPTISFSNLLQYPTLGASLRGKTVFVGATASGLDAGLLTPGSSRGTTITAVEFHARAYNALSSGLFYHRSDNRIVLALTLVTLLLAAALYVHIRRASTALITLLGLMLLPPVVSGVGLHTQQTWLSPIPAMFGLLLSGLLWLAVSLQYFHRSWRHARHDAHATLQSIADAVISVDNMTRIALLNPVAERLTRLRQQDVQGELLEPLLSRFSNSSAEVLDAVRACQQGGQTVRLPEPVSWQDDRGRERQLRVTATPIGDRSTGAVLALNDVTEALAATARLQHEATHDLLTGLPNRALLLDRLHQALASAQRHGSMLALLFVDLDRFKRVNDSLGHGIGDHVLKDVALRLQTSVRAGDTIARWGGDEFVILLDKLADRSAAITVATKILDLLDQEFNVDGASSLLLSCSIGISIGPHDSTDADALLLMADKAMYRGKLEGGSRYTFYCADMNLWSRERLELESALRQALTRNEFELFYQPQIDLLSGQLAGLESLIRWHRPGVGLVRPDLFIPTAEESGIIRSIGHWVIVEAVRQNAQWQREGLPATPISINISARQCADMALVDSIQEALEHRRLPPELLKIELTESTAMANAEHTAELLHNIHQLGVDIALDDFGTGYSSLSLLKRFPISQLKIDRSFVDKVGSSSDDTAIVRGTIALAHSLELNVVAEGVETHGQLDFLARHGCNTAQGFLFAQPLPAAEVRQWLSASPPHVYRSIARLRR